MKSMLSNPPNLGEVLCFSMSNNQKKYNSLYQKTSSVFFINGKIMCRQSLMWFSLIANYLYIWGSFLAYVGVVCACCVRVHAHLLAQARGGCQEFFFIVTLRQHPSVTPELGSQSARTSCLHLPPHSASYRQPQHSWLFTWVLEIQTQVLVFTESAATHGGISLAHDYKVLNFKNYI